MSNVKVYINPSCAACKVVMKLLDEKKIDFDEIDYYRKRFTADKMKELLSLLSIKPIDLIRKNEEKAKMLKIGKTPYKNEQLISFLVEYPDLIQRPIVVSGSKAVVARPAHRVKEVVKL